jgi:enoyl-CoA hydratase
MSDGAPSAGVARGFAGGASGVVGGPARFVGVAAARFVGGELSAPAAGVGQLTIDRPPVNALGAEAYDGLAAALREVSRSPEVRALVVTAAGARAFSAGSDTSEFQTPGDYERIAAAAAGFFAALDGVPVPIVGALNGPAVGGGAMIAAECDVLLAVPTAHLSIPELSLGVPGSGSHAKRLGPYFKVQRMLLLGERMTPEEAVALGTVAQLVAPESLRSVAVETASRIAALEPDAVRAARAIFRARESTAAQAGYGSEMAAAVPIVSARLERERHAEA